MLEGLLVGWRLLGMDRCSQSLVVTPIDTQILEEPCHTPQPEEEGRQQRHISDHLDGRDTHPRYLY